MATTTKKLEKQGEALIKAHQAYKEAKELFKTLRDQVHIGMDLESESELVTELGTISLIEFTSSRFQTKEFKKEHLGLYMEFSKSKTSTKVVIDGEDDE